MQVQPQVVMMQAQPVALDAKHLQSVDPFDPGQTQRTAAASHSRARTQRMHEEINKWRR